MSQLIQLQRLIDIMDQLRDPDNGCPWDLQQDFNSLLPYTLEEVYELVEAVEQNNTDDIINELGDLLFHLTFYARLGREQNAFDLEMIAAKISAKMIHRHPHVFADHRYESEEAFKKDWQKRKLHENRDRKKPADADQSLMSTVSSALPAVSRAVKIQQKAEYVGFDWTHSAEVLAKIKEEVEELENELLLQRDRCKIAQEMGDVLFSCVNLARHLGLDPETELRQANNKFIRRFKQMEALYDYDHEKMQQTSMEQLQQSWDKVKSRE